MADLVATTPTGLGRPESDEARTALLCLDPEVDAGTIDRRAISPEALKPLRSGGPRSLPIRLAHAVATKRNKLDGFEAMIGPGAATRRAVLGVDAAGPPRILVHADEFPYFSAFDEPDRYGMATATRFHEHLVAAEVPYLMAVVPQLTRQCLDPTATGGRELEDEELELLRRMSSDGVVFGQHGTTHRTRHAAPYRRSELCGLDPRALDELLERGRAKLAAIGIDPRVFVPPFNRFDASQWPILAARYSVVTGGPESVPLIGALPSPMWWGGAVYVPTYAPLYGRSGSILVALQQLVDACDGCWISIVLHTAWETDDGFESLKRLLEWVAPYATPWQDFLAAVDRSAAVSAAA